MSIEPTSSSGSPSPETSEAASQPTTTNTTSSSSASCSESSSSESDTSTANISKRDQKIIDEFLQLNPGTEAAEKVSENEEQAADFIDASSKIHKSSKENADKKEEKTTQSIDAYNTNEDSPGNDTSASSSSGKQSSKERL